MRGVSGDSPEGGARLGVPRLRLVTAGSGGAETARRALRPVLRGARCTHLRRQCRRRKRGPEAENRQGGAPRGARPSAEGRKALRKRLACRVMCRPNGCRSTRAPVGAPPTPRMRVGCKVTTRAQTRRGNEMQRAHRAEWLFEIVRCERGCCSRIERRRRRALGATLLEGEGGARGARGDNHIIPVLLKTRQFIGTFARFTTSPQRATSFSTCPLNSSGVLAIMSKPSVLMRTFMSALARMLMISPCSFFTIARSRPAGPRSEEH